MANRSGTPSPAPSRRPLTRRRILECSLKIIDRDGLETLSMRKLAAELDVAAMSLYNHVPNKDSLLEGVTEVLLGEIDLASTEKEDWMEAMRDALLSFRDVLLAHPNAMPLIQSKPIMTPEAFHPVEQSLATLRRGGFGPEDALRSHWALIGFTLGHVAFQLMNPLTDPDRAEARMAMTRDNLAPAEFPCFYESLPFAVGCDFEAAFELGLDALLVGLKARLAGSTNAPEPSPPKVVTP